MIRPAMFVKVLAHKHRSGFSSKETTRYHVVLTDGDKSFRMIPGLAPGYYEATSEFLQAHKQAWEIADFIGDCTVQLWEQGAPGGPDIFIEDYERPTE